MGQVKWIDENTAIATDKSIFLIDLSGHIQHFPGDGWKKPREFHNGKFRDVEPFWHYKIGDAAQSKRIIELIYSEAAG